jgi:hypothetical protein
VFGNCDISHRKKREKHNFYGENVLHPFLVLARVPAPSFHSPLLT